ncbi:helix-turn-helix domain-containing protein [Streptomyces sp. NPDC002088]|uniref:PucR family transcriptional regulator n=1 Tax=Streptomyces sp. NPDC002088 TaxID=3154665 RepID=UPI00332E44C0
MSSDRTGIEPEDITAAVATVAKRLQAHRDEVTQHITDAIARDVEGLDEPQTLEQLYASVEANTSTILSMLHNAIPPDHAQAAPAALEYARALASRGVPGDALHRGYQYGTDNLMDWIFREIQALESPDYVKLYVLRKVAGFMHRYVDWVTKELLAAHAEEQRRWAEQAANVASAIVRRILDSDEDDQAARQELLSNSNYDLHQWHLALTLWFDGPGRGGSGIEALMATARQLARKLGSRREPLLTTGSKGALWAWVGLTAGDASSLVDLDSSTINQDLGSSHVRVALGSAAYGTHGFRLSHQQAEQARLVLAVSASQRCLAYCDNHVPVLAMMVHDPSRLRTWIREVLGPLADDTDNAARLRDTALAFLRNDGNYQATADALILHRNTVRYRLQRVEELRGRTLLDDRLELELALSAAAVLGTERAHRLPLT